MSYMEVFDMDREVYKIGVHNMVFRWSTNEEWARCQSVTEAQLKHYGQRRMVPIKAPPASPSKF